MDWPITDRQEFILSRLGESGRVEVNEVAEACGVSTMTVRRDLADMNKAGQVQRVHGGAIAVRSPFFVRAEIASDEKQRIAKVVNTLVNGGDTVCIDVGTTCRAVAVQLATRDNLLAVATSLQVATEFQRSKSSMLVLGGVMNDDFSLVNGGPLGGSHKIHLDKFVIGCGGISVDGVSHFDIAETETRRELVRNSDKVILAADHTKLEQRKAILLGGLDLLDVLVTTAEPPKDLRRALDGASVEVIVAD